MKCVFSPPESHQKDHAEGHRGGEDCDGGSCDHLYPLTPADVQDELHNVHKVQLSASQAYWELCDLLTHDKQ